MLSHLPPPPNKYPRHDVKMLSASITDALKEHFVNLSVPVPVTAFEKGYAALYSLLDNPEFYDAVESGSLTEEQLRLRIALFHHAAGLLPLTPLEFFQWAESLGEKHYTRWFISSRITSENNFAAISHMKPNELEALTDYLIALRVQSSELAA